MALNETLGSYLTQLRRILHDSSDQFWSQVSKTAYINQALQQRDRDCGMNRAITNLTLTVGQPFYPMTATNSTTLDVVGIGLFNGNLRIQLEQRPYTELVMRYQSITSFTQQPVAFARYGASSLIFAPVPDQAYRTEWDCLLTTPTLVNSIDADPLPYPWTDPVPYMAAHFANLEIQKIDEADRFLKIYQERMNGVLAGARGMMVVQPYFSIESGFP